MEANKILSADILDIVFEGRNKEYGAYELRKGYRKRLIIAMVSLGVLFIILGGAYFLANNFSSTDDTKAIVTQEVQLEDIKQPEKEEPPPPPPPKPPDPPKVEIAKFTPPKIVKDEEVKEEEKPPEMEKLEETKIGVINQEGIKDLGIVAPPNDDKGVVEAPKRDETDYDQTFTKVEIESSYPGGAAAWQRYLIKTLRYPQEAQDNEIQGPVVVQFIVDKGGNVSNVEAVSGPKELREEAVRVIQKSGKWTPAVQNGRQVKSYKKQPIVFRLETN